VDHLDSRGALTYLAKGKGTRCAVLPSRSENAPQAITELVFAGLPFIASSAGGIPELIHPESHSSVLVQARNASALAEALVGALKHGVAPARPARPMDDLQRGWVRWHERAVLCGPEAARPPPPKAKGSACLLVATTDRGALVATARSLLDQSEPFVTELLVALIGITNSSRWQREAAALAKSTRLPVRTLSARSRSEAVGHCAKRSLQGPLLLVEAGTILQQRAVGVLVSSLLHSGAAGVTPMSHVYSEWLDLAALGSAAKLREAMPAPSRFDFRPLLGPSTRMGVFRNLLGSEVLLLTRELLAKVADLLEAGRGRAGEPRLEPGEADGPPQRRRREAAARPRNARHQPGVPGAGGHGVSRDCGDHHAGPAAAVCRSPFRDVRAARRGNSRFRG